ncbi:DNA polymerase III subunit delta' [Endozoicomonas sp. (ex Bugula neritina AB1)]|nr:DNA polymerase III subunit delta' [Endozoicomonas sp. (ex Bugula neritina AB1)]
MKENWQILPWHQNLWQSLMGQEQSDRLAHAYLLRGVPGVGKFQFAKALAAQLLCEHIETEYACGHCKECELVKAGTHPDLLFVEPDAAGKPIKIDQVRRVNEFARKTAQQGGRRIVVMNPAEAMNINSANALLKSLEEPGNNTVFLLVSARAGDMLPTIRSRCQLLPFSVPPTDVATKWLSEHITDQMLIEQLLVLAGGAPAFARDMFDQGALELRGKLINAMADLFRGDITPVELAKEWQNTDSSQLLGWLASWLDDVVRIGLGAEDSSIRNRDLTKMLNYLSGKAPVKTVVRLRDDTLEQRQFILDGANLNIQMMLEGIFSRYLDLVI